LRTEKFCASTCVCARVDGLGHHAVLDGTPSPCRGAASARQCVRAEDAHQVVFERQVETRGTRVALAAGAATQLVVDAACLVPLGPEDVQAAESDDFVVVGVGLLLEVREDALPVGRGTR
jgi:hypothetical protein